MEGYDSRISQRREKDILPSHTEELRGPEHAKKAGKEKGGQVHPLDREGKSCETFEERDWYRQRPLPHNLSVPILEPKARGREAASGTWDPPRETGQQIARVADGLAILEHRINVLGYDLIEVAEGRRQMKVMMIEVQEEETKLSLVSFHCPGGDSAVLQTSWTPPRRLLCSSRLRHFPRHGRHHQRIATVRLSRVFERTNPSPAAKARGACKRG